MQSRASMGVTYLQRVIQLCFTLPIVYTVALMYPFFTNRQTVIPLTYRTQFNRWGELRGLYEGAPSTLSWANISAVVWCPLGRSTSPQCGCFMDYFEDTYLPAALNLTLQAGMGPTAADFGKKHGRDAVMSCLRLRPSWRKTACGPFCRLHVGTPVTLSCLYMLMFFSKMVDSSSVAMQAAARFVPGLMALTVIVTQLGMESTGGLLASLSVASSYTESLYIPSAPGIELVFWSYHRYLCGAMAVWAAVTHQARDVYEVAMYGAYGFTAGLLAYMVFLIKSGRPCRPNLHTCIVVWLGICAVAGMFVLLIQQNWYSHSRQSSSVASVLCLFVCLCQCLFQTPYDVAPVSLHVMLSLTVLSLAFGAVMADTA